MQVFLEKRTKQHFIFQLGGERIKQIFLAFICPLNLRMAKGGKIFNVFSPLFVIWSFISPTGNEKENIFSIFRHLRPKFSNRGVRGEKS